MQQPPPFSAYLHPRHWPTWTGVFLLMVIAWLPFTLRLIIGESLGMLTYWFGRERRYITAINIDICFASLDAGQRRELVKRSFRENGIGLVETATSWFRKADGFKDRTTMIGLDKVKAAEQLGRGVLLIGAHYSTLDLAGCLLSAFHPFAATYRPHNNPLFNAFMMRGRLSNCSELFDRNDIRGAFRHLKQGNTLWYAPDQDYGPRHAVYAPFFGKPAATITATSRFAACNDSPVFLIRHHRIGRNNRYEFEFTPFPESFPEADEVANATLVNGMIEQAIMKYPAQYLWMHKRFKTQPGGKPDSPYIDIRTPNHRLTDAQYAQMLEGAQLLSARDDISDYRLPNGLRLRQYPGLVGKRFYQRHPARTFDRQAKVLRALGFPCITVDNFFRVENQHISAVTYFAPTGDDLRPPWPLPALGEFVARLHAKGIRWDNPSATDLLVNAATLAIADPTPFTRKADPALRERTADLQALAARLHLNDDDRGLLFHYYAQASGLPAVTQDKA